MLTALVMQQVFVAQVAEALGVAGCTANHANLVEGRRAACRDSARFSSVRVVEVGKHLRRHGRRGERFVMVVIDPTRSVSSRVLLGFLT